MTDALETLTADAKIKCLRTLLTCEVLYEFKIYVYPDWKNDHYTP